MLARNLIRLRRHFIPFVVGSRVGHVRGADESAADAFAPHFGQIFGALLVPDRIVTRRVFEGTTVERMRQVGLAEILFWVRLEVELDG